MDRLAKQFLTAVVPRFLSLTALPNAIAEVSLRLTESTWGAVYEVTNSDQQGLFKLWLGVKGARAQAVFWFPKTDDIDDFKGQVDKTLKGLPAWKHRWKTRAGAIALENSLEAPHVLLTNASARVHLTEDVGVLASLLVDIGERREPPLRPWTLPDPSPGANPWPA